MGKIDDFKNEIGERMAGVETAMNGWKELRKESREDFQRFQKDQNDRLDKIFSSTEMTRITTAGHEIRIKSNTKQIRGIWGTITAFVLTVGGVVARKWL